MRQDGKIARTVYVGAGVASEEWIDPPAKKGGSKKHETKPEPEKAKKE